MRYKPYPAYKDSGNEWLGEIPEGWDIYRLKETTKRIPYAIVDGPFGSMLKADEYQEEGVPLVRITNLSYSGDFSSEDLVHISDLKAAELSRSTVKYGDIVIGKTGATIGKFAPYPNQQPGVLASSCIKITFSDTLIELAFIRYIFMSKPFQEELIETSGGSTRDTINIGPFGNLHVSLPPLSTQKAIAAFLDAKTARIDGLVRDYEELVSLLKEKRQALVSHAVTRGLSELVSPDDPDFGEWARSVAFKDSGVEWLGEIPEGWEVKSVKYCCSLIKDGTHLPPSRVENGIPLLSVRNIHGNIFGTLEDDSMISEDDYKALCKAFVPQKNDVLLAIVGATLGKTAIVPDGIGRFHIQRSLAVFRPNQTVLPRFMFSWMQSDNFQKELWNNVGFSAQPGIYLGTLCQFKIPCAPLSEQKAIAAFLDRETAKLDSLVAEAEGAIELLKERRSALITAAVTGKINVEEMEVVQP